MPPKEAKHEVVGDAEDSGSSWLSSKYAPKSPQPSTRLRQGSLKSGSDCTYSAFTLTERRRRPLTLQGQHLISRRFRKKATPYMGSSLNNLAGSLSGVVVPLVTCCCMPLSFSAAFPSLGNHHPVRGVRLLADVALFVAEVSVSLPLSCCPCTKLT